PIALSNTSSTDERPAGLRCDEPLKITSCIDSPRNSEALDSPRTQRTASIILDLPQPFGPTTPTNWPGTWKLVGSTKDLNPDNLMEVKRTLSTVPIKIGRKTASPQSKFMKTRKKPRNWPVS